MTRSLGIRTFIRWIRRSKAEEVGREIVNRISLRSIKHPTLPSPHPPITISEFIERINYFVTRDKHVKTNFGNAGFTCLLVEFTGGLLVLIRLPLNYARGSSPRNQIGKFG